MCGRDIRTRTSPLRRRKSSWDAGPRASATVRGRDETNGRTRVARCGATGGGTRGGRAWRAHDAYGGDPSGLAQRHTFPVRACLKRWLGHPILGARRGGSRECSCSRIPTRVSRPSTAGAHLAPGQRGGSNTRAPAASTAAVARAKPTSETSACIRPGRFNTKARMEYEDCFLGRRSSMAEPSRSTVARLRNRSASCLQKTWLMGAPRATIRRFPRLDRILVMRGHLRTEPI